MGFAPEDAYAQGFMANLPQSWHAGTEAQSLISCFELLAQLAALLCRLPSPLPIPSASHCGKARQRHCRRGCHERVHDSTSPASLRSGHHKMGTIFGFSLKSTSFQGSTTRGPTHSAKPRIRSKVSSRLHSALNFV